MSDSPLVKYRNQDQSLARRHGDLVALMQEEQACGSGPARIITRQADPPLCSAAFLGSDAAVLKGTRCLHPKENLDV